jgi:hypothetical protein
VVCFLVKTAGDNRLASNDTIERNSL